MGCCSSKIPNVEGYKAYGKMVIPAQESIDFIIRQGQKTDSFVKENVATPLLKGVNFATVGDNDEEDNNESDSVDDEAIEKLLNDNKEEESEHEKEINDQNTVTRFREVKSDDENVNSEDEKDEI
ncbi:hypothetical protein TVAG_495070 [Trichomonas vaginalis G3]|uniref:Uncharacterized protein n=1 Tax=Trichomonas vaginalis (strain ATCC PRA-98 / G3) TaxID=412133 RepID=A2FWP2_TRIV3|nr:hypothetical protein TVAGG3_0250780 [Trichomonas vaginalis G3]EAX90670.1 hypothetical protein TVAG_495070 [Trichomonas vaginalis G3]KAI5553990.1 hypothetical protein TVAGG3_0250780 [Trichomonas vaginalis G3]|eukprot:XP_001303600.1 hypothetical protein [Trichomonas vaginalis G3]